MLSLQRKFLASTKREPSFISKGFTYWKEVTTAFKKHQGSDCHREATEALVLLPQQVMGNIGEMLSNEAKEERAINRKVFLTVIQNISFLARQGLPLRGQGDIASNFHKLLLLRSADCDYITQWLRGQ